MSSSASASGFVRASELPTTGGVFALENALAASAAAPGLAIDVELEARQVVEQALSKIVIHPKAMTVFQQTAGDAAAAMRQGEPHSSTP